MNCHQLIWPLPSFLFFKIYLFVYFRLRWVFIAACGLPLVAASGGYSLLRCAGFSLRWFLLLRSTGSRCAGFSSCGMQAQQLWRTGLVALWHVGSSWTRAQTCVSCIGRWILNHCATRDVLAFLSDIILYYSFCFSHSCLTDVSGIHHLHFCLSTSLPAVPSARTHLQPTSTWLSPLTASKPLLNSAEKRSLITPSEIITLRVLYPSPLICVPYHHQLTTLCYLNICLLVISLYYT